MPVSFFMSFSTLRVIPGELHILVKRQQAASTASASKNYGRKCKISSKNYVRFFPAKQVKYDWKTSDVPYFLIFCRNYSFLNLEIQRSQYMRPKVTVHKCAETIQGWKLYEEIRYLKNQTLHLSPSRNFRTSWTPPDLILLFKKPNALLIALPDILELSNLTTCTFQTF